MQGTGVGWAGVVGSASADGELWVEEVAARLGLPVAMLIRRIEAGVLPARRVHDAGRVRYRVQATSFGMQGPPEPAELVGRGRTAATETPAVAPPARVETPPTDGVAASGTPGRREPNVEIAQPRYELRREPDAGARDIVDRDALSTATLDARELVAALLDRFETTLDQRLHAEYRLRFSAQSEAQQRRIAELESEAAAAGALVAERSEALERVAAEHARTLADCNRRLAAATAELAELRAQSTGAAARDAALAQAARELAALQADLGASRRAALEREKLDGDRERLLAGRDRETDELRRQLAERERLAVQLRTEVGERDRALDDLHAQLIRRDEELDALLAARGRKGLFRRS